MENCGSAPACRAQPVDNAVSVAAGVTCRSHAATGSVPACSTARCAPTKPRADLRQQRVIHSFHRCYDSYETYIRIDHSVELPSGTTSWGRTDRDVATSRTHRRARSEPSSVRIQPPWQDAHRPPHRRPRRTPHREVPRRARRARRCRRLGCPQPPGPPERPRPRRPADRGQRRGPGALDLRLRDLRPGHAHRPRSPTRARRWSAAGCSPTSAAACPTSRSRWCSTARGSR